MKNEHTSVPACTSLGCKKETAAPHGVPKSKDYPKDYFVPDFGMDRDIAHTMKHTADMEKKYGEWKIDLKKKEEPPKDYPVPNLGMDHDIKDSLKNTADQENIHGTCTPQEDVQTKNEVHVKSDPICNSSGCTQYLHPDKKLPYPIDYPVPDFGVDQDIADSQQHEKDAEKRIDPQSLTGTKTDIRLNSDPICNSSGCTQYLHPNKKLPYPVDYPVPDFGVDHEIADSQQHEKAASDKIGHTWEPTKDPETEKWVVPTATAEFKLAGTKSDIRLSNKAEQTLGWSWNPDKDDDGKWMLATKADVNAGSTSDPICASSGWCGPDGKKDKEKPVVYPMYPLDSDVTSTQAHIKEQEAIHGKWDLPKYEDTQYYNNNHLAPSKDHANIQVQNEIHQKSDPACTSNGCETRHSNPSKKPDEKVFYSDHTSPLDSDIQSTNKHMGDAEAKLGKWDYLAAQT